MALFCKHFTYTNFNNPPGKIVFLLTETCRKKTNLNFPKMEEA